MAKIIKKLRSMSKEILILYVPVIHDGYEKLFQELSRTIKEVYVLDNDLIDEFTGLHTEIRALKPERAVKYLIASGYFERVCLLNRGSIEDIKNKRIVILDDQLCRGLAEKYLTGSKVQFKQVFLRYDEKNVFSRHSVSYSRISTNRFDRKIMKLVRDQAPKSSDWWRQVGAALVRGKDVVLCSHNQHIPSEHSPYMNGDPRDFIKAGERSEFTSALHSEQMIIAKAAHDGIKLSEGKISIYVTVFPCPMCAIAIAYSGIKKCYFGSGHASLKGEDILRMHGVEIILVK